MTPTPLALVPAALAAMLSASLCPPSLAGPSSNDGWGLAAAAMGGWLGLPLLLECKGYAVKLLALWSRHGLWRVRRRATFSMLPALLTAKAHAGGPVLAELVLVSLGLLFTAG